jgi:hypothetical protein
VQRLSLFPAFTRGICRDMADDVAPSRGTTEQNKPLALLWLQSHFLAMACITLIIVKAECTLHEEALLTLSLPMSQLCDT